jgi:hypothetical protein
MAARRLAGTHKGWEGLLLHYWNAIWDLDEKQCPCDLHFVEWLHAEGISGKTIYHMGTGTHHVVGLDNLENGERNNIVAITASPGEYDAFVKHAIAHPRLSQAYSVYFGDLYLLNTALLPRFDLVTLFHLCEFRDARNDAYGALTDEEVVRRFVAHLNPGGRILFYEGSFAFPSARPILDKLVKEGVLEAAGQFKTLPIYTAG